MRNENTGSLDNWPRTHARILFYFDSADAPPSWIPYVIAIGNVPGHAFSPLL